MRILKIILGVTCLVAALPAGFVALGVFFAWGAAGGGTLVLGLCFVALIWAGWLLIRKRDSHISWITVTMLVVVAGVAVFPAAFMLTHPVENRPRAFEARAQMQHLENAIIEYKEEFGHLPIPANLLNLNSNDFTFGTWNTSLSALGITNATGSQANNSAIIAILLAWTNCPDFLHVTSARYKFPGVGADGVLRDPWGNPYIVTLDLNGDNRCRDTFYRLASVSEQDSSAQGLNGLTRRASLPGQSSEARDSFEARGIVMAWSLGPDGKADRSKKANVGVNKDNIVMIVESWRSDAGVEP
jgi:type II secretory pathway pseudopilin PulG